MDFLDPQKLRAHQVRLIVGYVLMAIVVVLAATVLLYQAYGFGVKQGKVIQNGLVFVQSTPGGATVELNGRRQATTDARLVLEAGSYTMKLTRQGYRDWQRALTVEGGSAEHFTYPFLVPRQLDTATVTTYQALPPMVTQSPDRRWLLVHLPGQFGSFDLYDVKDPEQSQALRQTISLPDGLMALPAAEPRSLEVVDWSNDNKHVVLRHTSGGQSEYLLFSRDKPAESVNLTRSLELTPNLTLSLQDKKYDHYFIHDTVAKTVSTASLAEPQSVPMLTGVLAYKTYGNDTVLYVSPVANQPDRVQVKLYQDRRQYNLRTIPIADAYLLALSRFDGAWLAGVAAPSEGRTYIYKDPVADLRRDAVRPAVPAAVLKVAGATTVAFSANSQLIMAQNGNNFAVYDAEYDRSHTYSLEQPLDAPQAKAAWLDSHHLHYVSGGRAIMFDYDGTNVQSLAAQSASLPPLYDTGYTTLYTLARPAAPGANAEAHVFSATPLRTAADR